MKRKHVITLLISLAFSVSVTVDIRVRVEASAVHALALDGVTASGA